MNPDVFVTIAFVCYAVFVTIGIGVGAGLFKTQTRHEQGIGEDPAQGAGRRERRREANG